MTLAMRSSAAGIQTIPISANLANAGERSGRDGAPTDRAVPARGAVIDHISFGISPWDVDGVRAELEKRSLPVTVDTSSAHPGLDGKMVQRRRSPGRISELSHDHAQRVQPANQLDDTRQATGFGERRQAEGLLK